MSKKDLFILFCALLVFAGVMAVMFVWNANGFFTGAYTPVVEESRERQRLIKGEETTSEPRAAGFKESELEKQQGDRYTTY